MSLQRIRRPLASPTRILGVLAASAATLLASTAADAQPVANPHDQTRVVSFEYHPNGVLRAEIVEPGTPSQCMRTEHSYDAFGNKSGNTVAHCTDAPALARFRTRTSTTTFGSQAAYGGLPAAPTGTFATTSSVVVGDRNGNGNTTDPGETHTEQRVHDVRFGDVVQLIGPNGAALKTEWEYDEFGRKVRETRADGTYTVMRHCILTGKGLDTSSNTSGCPTPASGEAPAPAVRFETAQSFQSSGAAISGLARTYFDRAGQAIRSVSDGFDGHAIAQDTHYTPHGAVRLKTEPYFLAGPAAGRSTVGGSGGVNNHGMTAMVYDALGRTVAVFTNQPPASGGSGGSVEAGSTTHNFGPSYTPSQDYGTRTATRLQTLHDGLSTTITNDDGRQRKEERSVDGKVIRTTDPLGAQVGHRYDALGQLIETRDALGNRIVVQYDRRGRKLRLEDPDAGNTDYCYDALGQLKAQQTSNQRGGHGTGTCPSFEGSGLTAPAVANWTTLAYDALGRLVSRTSPEYTTSWHFDTQGATSTATCGPSLGKPCLVTTSHGVTRTYTYDTLGRPQNSRLDVSGGPSAAQSVEYDSAGRARFQTYPTGLRVEHHYNARSQLTKVTTATAFTGLAGGTIAAGSTLWEAITVSAWGKAEKVHVGHGANALESRAEFDARTGRLLRLSAGPGTASTVLDQRLSWDNLGQLTQRIDAIGAGGSSPIHISDTYVYDAIGRLTQYTVAGSGTPSSRTVQLQYNAAGMLLFKTDVGIYTYGPQGTANGRPHALQRVDGAHSASYGYDLNGNVVSATGGKYRSVAYTSFNLPDSGNGLQGPGGSPKFTWQYDDAQARIRETRVNAAGTRTTWYLHPDNQGGLGFEREVSTNGAAQNRHFISAGGVAIGVVVTSGNLPTLASGATAPPVSGSMAVARMEYWHKDHLGSLLASTNHQGAVTARYSYDPFGKRRNVSGKYDAFGTVVLDFSADPAAAGTDRGYTGHEHLDDVGLIHMNGRVFDPVIGRFMQADPFIQEPGNLQNYDRYAYCFNSPATCTDPSGYIGKWLERKVRRELRRSKTFQQLASLAITVASAYCGPYASLCNAGGQAALAGYAGASTEEALKAGGRAFISTEVNHMLGGVDNPYWNAAGHAAWGCAEAKMNGGRCSDGIKGAFAYSALKGIGFGPSESYHFAVNAGIRAATGGLVAELTGGDFWTAARTAAYAYLFNEASREFMRRWNSAAERMSGGRRKGASAFYPENPALKEGGEGGSLSLYAEGSAGIVFGASYQYALTDSIRGVCTVETVCFLAGPFAGLSRSRGGELSFTPPSDGLSAGLFGVFTLGRGVSISLSGGSGGPAFSAAHESGGMVGWGAKVCRARVIACGN
jgi:RHS repeat-associated protein